MLTTIRSPVPVSATSSTSAASVYSAREQMELQSLPPSPTASPFSFPQPAKAAHMCGASSLSLSTTAPASLLGCASRQAFAELTGQTQLTRAISGMDQPAKFRLLSGWVEQASLTDLQLLSFLIKPRLKMDIVGALPYELCSKILGFLDARSLLSAASVSRKWRHLCADDQLWATLCVRANARMHPQSGPAMHALSYKHVYRAHYLTERAWRSGEPQLQSFLSPATGVITSMQADDEKIVVGLDINGVGAIYIFSTRTGEWLKTLTGHEGGVWCLQFKGDMLVSGGCDRGLRVWDVKSGRCLSVLRGHTSTVRCLQLLSLPDHPFAAISGSRDGSLRVWDLESGECLHTLSGHSASVRCVAVHGTMAVSGSYDGTARVWDLETGACKFFLGGHSDKVYSAVYNDKYICTGAMDRTVHVWSPTTGECTAVLQGHEMLVGHLQLEDDILITGGSDGRVCIWHLPTLTCKHKIHAHPTAVTSLHYDKHSQRLVTGGDDGVKIWDAATGALSRVVTEGVSSVWRVACDHRRLMAAVQRPEGTMVEMMDFGADC